MPPHAGPLTRLPGCGGGQAKPPADTFIGYGGVVVREKVRDGADWFVHDFNELIAIVK